jgi:hypothetical protein
MQAYALRCYVRLHCTTHKIIFLFRIHFTLQKIGGKKIFVYVVDLHVKASLLSIQEIYEYCIENLNLLLTNLIIVPFFQ